MMDPKEVTAALERVVANGQLADSIFGSEEWSRAADGIDAVEPVLRFIESNPDLEYGTPGPLVHFVEQFRNEGYEHELIKSIRRKPVGHTIWMLNRLINGTADSERRQYLVEIMRSVSTDAGTNERARKWAVRFLARWSR